MRIFRLLFALLLVSVGVYPAVDPAPASAAPASAVPVQNVDRTSDAVTRATRSALRAPLLPSVAAVTTSAAPTTTAAPTPPPTTAAPTTTEAPVRPAVTTTAAPRAAAAAEAAAPAAVDSNGVGKEAVAATARAQVGKAYVSGATGPNAFDCSGFVYWVYNQAGISIPRLTSDGYFARSTHITRAELEPGDIVVSRGHIGIYVGNGQMVHASTPRGGVKLASMDVVTPIGYGRLS